MSRGLGRRVKGLLVGAHAPRHRSDGAARRRPGRRRRQRNLPGAGRLCAREEVGYERSHPRTDAPVGEPVVRSDPAVTGERAAEAVGFDPDDPDSVAEAAETVARFAAGDVGDDDHVLMLRGRPPARRARPRRRLVQSSRRTCR